MEINTLKYPIICNKVKHAYFFILKFPFKNLSILSK